MFELYSILVKEIMKDKEKRPMLSIARMVDADIKLKIKEGKLETKEEIDEAVTSSLSKVFKDFLTTAQLSKLPMTTVQSEFIDLLVKNDLIIIDTDKATEIIKDEIKVDFTNKRNLKEAMNFKSQNVNKIFSSLKSDIIRKLFGMV